MTKEKYHDYLIIPKWIQVIDYLRQGANNQTNLSKEMNITFSHVCAIVGDLRDLGYITHDPTKGNNRTRYYTLTETGEILAGAARKMIEVTEAAKEQRAELRKK